MLKHPTITQEKRMTLPSPLKASAGRVRLLAFLALLLGLGAAPALAQTPCPANFEGQTAPVTCMCSAQAVAGAGTVWGSGVYTTDSAVCRAARHANAVPPEGGMVTVTPAPGLPAYVGTVANGIATQNYGPWPRSFTIAAAARGAGAEPQNCPQNFIGQTAPITCVCTAEAAAAGTVWGTGVYTTDSRLCRAAVHAGAIPPTGGLITVRPAPGMPAYVGSPANGVTTANYGPWSASFTVIRAEAAAPAAAACPQNFIGQNVALTCTCTAEAAGAGTVWGTGVYTTDSRICRAAVHAGVIPPTGGTVNVVPAPGMPAYQGSTANGIQTSNYGPWSGSFTFRR
jgi:predicted nucleic acid-binding Zn ribbon protein